MTEAEWMTRADQESRVLDPLQDRASDRKLRLFACACCRRIRHLLTSQQAWDAVEVAERFADGQAADGERSEARRSAQRASQSRSVTRTPTAPKWERYAASAAYWAAARDATEAYRNAPHLADVAVGLSGGRGERAAQAALYRDIFGNPASPITGDSDALTPDVVNLARAVYDDRAFGRMPELADALEKAGCADAGILGHCRGEGPHVRGCWVVDLILGKG
jgi:hypothetical protein